MKSTRLPLVYNTLHRTATTHSGIYNPKYVNLAKGGKHNFEKDFENSHVKTNLFQKFLLGVGSGVISITSPSRGDMIAVMGEVTGYQAWEYIQSKMLQSKEGKQILEEKPRISSGSIDLEKLKSYPEGTLGKAYSNFLTQYGYSPDSRNAVQFVDDIELAYVAQRYREAHDLFHTLLGMPTNMLGEVTVKWVEAIQLKLPMCAAGALFGSVRLAPKFTRAYSTKSIVKIDPEVAQKVENKLIKPKDVPGSLHLPCVQLPEFYLKSIAQSLKGQDRKLIREEAKVLRQILNKRPLPLEFKDVDIQKKRLYRELENEFLDEDGICVWDKLDKEVERRLRRIFHTQITFWKKIKYDLITSFQYLLCRTPGEYAAVKKVLREISKRDETFTPKKILDFGSGVGSVTWIAHELWGNSIEEYFCVDSSGDMHELADMLLTENNTLEKPLINNVHYRYHLPISNNLYDIVVSSFSLLELNNRETRMKFLTRLWNHTKDYLVVIENGNHAGFKIITEVRDYLIEANKNFGIDYHIFAPCPHEEDCPILTLPINKPKCCFSVLYKNLYQFKKEKVECQLFSYIIFKKGETPPLDRKCRIIKKVLKRHKRAHCFMCTTKAEFKEIVVTKSNHGQVAYQCMRKARWGDLLSGVLEDVKKIDQPSHPLLDQHPSIQDSEEEFDSDDSEDDGEYFSSDESEDESDQFNDSGCEVKDTDVNKKPE